MPSMSEFCFNEEGYRFDPRSRDFYISFISDATHPLLGVLPADKPFNRVCVVISENTPDSPTIRYILKKTNNGNNGVIYESPEMPVPMDFRNKDAQNLLKEIATNVELNLKFLEGKYPAGVG